MHGALPKVSGGWMLRAKKLCQADGNMALGDVLLKYDVNVVWLYLQAVDALADFSCLGGTLGWHDRK